MSDERESIRNRLEAQRDDLAGRVDRLQAEARQSIGETDTAHGWENAEISEGQVDEALDELRQVEASLARLDRGEYGVCTMCGEPIEAERLELLPETVHCAEHA
jgi:RNA polymerase-binding transcription factor DksA